MPNGKRIHVLSDHVINKIAAGEVVDRPASVFKELIENALDAGATEISIDVVGGGRKAIVVEDNGSGMSRDDALLSIERHATSKIEDVDDIEQVATLGFRGEALAAIASVSRFSLETREAEALSGTEIIISGGKIQDVRDAGGPPGTTIRVRSLFFNVPARRKFLRTEPTELSHIRQNFLLYALSHPNVGLRLKADGRETYRLAAGSSLEERIKELFGTELFKGLRRVEHGDAQIRVEGYAGLPQISRNNRNDQYIFINGRPAGAPLILSAINEAYHTLIPKGRYPVLFLFLRVDPTSVDVNVHPTKREVRFRRGNEVRDGLIRALRAALTQPTAAGSAGPMDTPHDDKNAPLPVYAQPRLRIEDLPAPRTFQYPRLPLVSQQARSQPVAGQETDASNQDVSAPARASGPWAWCRVLGQVGGLYVILETEDGMVLMDPHAAHERVLFEKFMNDVVAGAGRGQGLLTPETIELTPHDALRVRKNLELFKKMGFGLAEFGGDTFMVDALPTCLGNASAAAVLVEVAHSLEEGGGKGGTERWAEERIAQAACKAAVKARDKLTLREIEQLVIDLARAELPYTCPHGRPTLIFMSYPELDRKFGRT